MDKIRRLISFGLIFRNEESLRHKIAAKLVRDLWMGVPLVETLLQKRHQLFIDTSVESSLNVS